MLKYLTTGITAIIFFTNMAFCQNITGTWEGIMGDEYLKLNIIQNGNRLCGYTFDFVLKDKKSFCKTYFTGNYDMNEKIWTINGQSFIINSGDHILMTLKFWQPPQSSRNELKGIVATGNSFFNFLDVETGNSFWLKKTNNIPADIPGFENICYVKKNEVPNKNKKEQINLPRKQTTVIPSINSDSTNNQQINTTDQSPKNNPENNSKQEKNNAQLSVNEKINSRRNISFSTIVVHDPEVEIKLYDNGIIDNDTVSIYYNKQLIRSNQRLTETPLVLKLKIDPNQKQNELILFAENLGGIPPNTALLVVTAGKKRYELHASANMKENAVLIFKYEP